MDNKLKRKSFYFIKTILDSQTLIYCKNIQSVQFKAQV